MFWPHNTDLVPFNTSFTSLGLSLRVSRQERAIERVVVPMSEHWIIRKGSQKFDQDFSSEATGTRLPQFPFFQTRASDYHQNWGFVNNKTCVMHCLLAIPAVEMRRCQLSASMARHINSDSIFLAPFLRKCEKQFALWTQSLTAVVPPKVSGPIPRGRMSKTPVFPDAEDLALDQATSHAGTGDILIARAGREHSNSYAHLGVR